MAYRFKYHPDGWIGKNNKYYLSYDDFTAAHSGFPISKGQFFELKTNGTLETISLEEDTYTGRTQGDLTPYNSLLIAINNIGA